MVTATYPPNKVGEAVQVFGKSLAEPLPSFLKRLHVLTPGGVGEPGIRTYSIFEADKGKEYEAFAELSRRMAWYHDIEGYRYHIEPLLTAEEAIPLLGLKMQ
ncbi:hypothetical protein ACFLWX_03730 [Chloroflexota bacterium]